MNRENPSRRRRAAPGATGDGIVFVHPLTARLCDINPGEIVCLCRPGRAAFATVVVSGVTAPGRLALSNSDLDALAACPGARVTMRSMENGRHQARSARMRNR